MTLEELRVVLTADNTKFKSAMQSATKTAEGFKSGMNSVGAAITAALSVTAIVAFSKACIDLGSDLAEVQNVVDTTFPAMNRQLNAWAKNAAEQFGLSETMAKQYSSTLGTMARSMGFTEAQAYDMGTSLAGLAGDIASFYNITQDEAYNKLKAVFTGETEAIKSLGVVMTEAALNQYAMAQGIGKTTSEMTEAEKVSLRYQYVLSSLSAASGDFAKTSDGWANQVRILQLRFDALRATIGQGLINALTPVLQVINKIMAGLQVVAEQFRTLTSQIFGDAGSTTAAITAAADASADISTGLSAATDSAKALQKAIFGFDTIHTLGTSETSSALTTALGGDASVETINSTGDAAEANSGALSRFTSGLKELIDAAKPFAGAVGAGFVDFWIGVKDNLVKIADSDLVAKVLGNMTDYLRNVDPDKAHRLGEALGEISAIVLTVGFASGLASVVTSLQSLSTLGAITVSLAIGWQAGSLISEIMGNDSVTMSDLITEIVEEGVDGSLGSNLRGWVGDSFVDFFSSAWSDIAGGRIISSIAMWGDDIASAWVQIFGLNNTLIGDLETMWARGWGALGVFLEQLVMGKTAPIAWKMAGEWVDAQDWSGNRIWAGVTALSSSIKTIWNATMLSVQARIQNATNSIAHMWNNIKSAWGEAFRGAANVAISNVNALITRINQALHFDYAGLSIRGRQILPALSVQIASLPQLPALADGGITTGPTAALIGEAGREAVLPLDSNTGWMDELAGKLIDAMMEIHMQSSRGGGQGVTVQNTIRINEQTLARTVAQASQGRDGRYNAIAAL